MSAIDISSGGSFCKEGKGYVNDISMSSSSLRSSSSDRRSFETDLAFVNSVKTPIQPINKGLTEEEGPVEEQGL